MAREGEAEGQTVNRQTFDGRVSDLLTRLGLTIGCLPTPAAPSRMSRKGAKAAKWPTLPESLYWDPSIPDPPAAAPVFPSRGYVPLSQMEAQLERMGALDAYQREEIWRFCEIRRRGPRRGRAA
jgi:hypothetical protein